MADQEKEKATALKEAAKMQSQSIEAMMKVRADKTAFFAPFHAAPSRALLHAVNRPSAKQTKS